MIREDQYAGLIMSHKSLQNQFAEMKKRAETAETRAGSRWNQYESERQSHAFSSRTGNHALELLKRWIEWARAHGHENGILDDSREFMKRASFPLDTQSMPSEMRETHIEVFAQEGDPSFICGGVGHITSRMIDEIEKDLDENRTDWFNKGNGRYLFTATREEATPESPAYFDLGFVSFLPLPNV